MRIGDLELQKETYEMIFTQVQGTNGPTMLNEC